MDDDRLYSPWKSPPKVVFCPSLTVSGQSPAASPTTSPQKARPFVVQAATSPQKAHPIVMKAGTPQKAGSAADPPVSPHVAAIEKSQRQLEEERERLRAERLRQKALLAEAEAAEAERSRIIKKFAADVRTDVETFHQKLAAVPPPTATVGAPQSVKMDTPFTRTVPVPPPRPPSPPRKPVMRDGKFAVVEDAIADRGWIERERLDNVHQREAFIDYEAQRKVLELERREAIKELHAEQERQMSEFRDRLERHRPPSPDIVTNWTKNPFHPPPSASPKSTPRRLGYDSPTKSTTNPAAAGPPDLVLNSARRPVQPADPKLRQDDERTVKSPRQQLGTLVAPL